MAYELPSLTYAYDALEPHIDARTMEIHHTKHHQAYIGKANAALKGHDALAAKSIDDLIAAMGPARRLTVVCSTLAAKSSHHRETPKTD